MEGNSFYQLYRRKGPCSDVVVCWTGDGWSDDTNDGVLFRHAGSAEKFAKSRKWAEVRNGDDRNSLFRVERLGALPKIDPAATLKCSDLSTSQANRVRIDGVPLFPVGGAVNAGDPRLPTMVLRPDLKRELGQVWATAIVHTTGVVVKVEAFPDHVSADYTECKLRVTAETREDLNTALGAVGVLKPDEIEPDVVRGNDDDDAPTAYVATVVLADKVE